VGVLDKFERGVERVMNTPFNAKARGDLKPVELASRLKRELDDRAQVFGRDRTVAPNQFTIELSTEDFDQIEAWGADALADELANSLTEYAASQHYSYLGPVAVGFSENLDLAAGHFNVHSATVRGAVAPATNAATDRHPMIEINGQRYLLTGPVTIIGRDEDADIPVEDPGVSRRHMEIRVTPAGVVATDLGSTNGMFVEGHQVPAATLLDGNTITIGRTRILYRSGADLGDE